jgi:tyrosine-specific transport protein
MKTFDSRLLGGILLIVGTSIGGGMLALPISNGPAGFVNSTLLLGLCWFIMVLGALAILEVNLWFPPGSNLISMTQATLGLPGKIVAWVAYLFLLYALLSAYIAGGSDVFQSLLHQVSLSIPSQVSTFLFVLIFGGIVYSGIRTVDYANRALMFGKFGICLLLLLMVLPRIHTPNLLAGNWHHASSALMILVTSFGFATIVPSLRTYFHNDAKKLRRAIIIGSLIPLIVYIAWDAAIMGVIPLEGEHGLLALLHSKHSTSDLTVSLMSVTQNNWITELFRFFSVICMLTAFLGVSLGLLDFLSDGLKIPKRGHTGLLIVLLAYLPPLLLVLFCPGIFITALNYAGLFVVILLILIPALMLWRGRYVKNLSLTINENTHKLWNYEDEKLPSPTQSSYRMKGGKSTALFLFLVAIFLIFLAIPG